MNKANSKIDSLQAFRAKAAAIASPQKKGNIQQGLNGSRMKTAKKRESSTKLPAATANNLTKFRVLIGIDPGVKTGIAVWDRLRKGFSLVETISIVNAQNYLLIQKGEWKNIFIRIEDARLRKWFGGADQRMERSGAGIREGIGSVKRDCQIWEEFCLFHGIEFELVEPKNNKTKLDAKLFANYTGWKARTSEHSRDAAMLVFGF
jgi:hypothetical protein